MHPPDVWLDHSTSQGGYLSIYGVLMHYSVGRVMWGAGGTLREWQPRGNTLVSPLLRGQSWSERVYISTYVLSYVTLSSRCRPWLKKNQRGGYRISVRLDPCYSHLLIVFRSRTIDHSQLWEKALEQYRKELKDGDDYESVIGVNSMEELLTQARDLEPSGARNKNILSSLSRLEPMLLHINDFSAVTALFLGASAKSAALVWGSIRIILTVLL